MKRIAYFFLFLSLMLSGCATNSGIVDLGNGTYMIAKQAATGFHGIGNIKAEAVQEGVKKCGSDGKSLKIISSVDSQPPYILGNFPRTELVFECLGGSSSSVVIKEPSELPKDRLTHTSNSSRGKLALVVGNDKYRSIPGLQNAVADSSAVANMLTNLGYSVRAYRDLTGKNFLSVIRDFRSRLSGGEEVVFFFAGHGVQIGSANYLLPTDVGSDSEDQIQDEGIPLQRVLDDFSESKVKFSLAMVDACRDNPFKSTGRSIGGRGLAATSAATGQMVIFSAGVGQQALDRLGNNDKARNGLFTRVLIDKVSQSKEPIHILMRDVRAEVAKLAQSVGHEQVPAIYDQVIGDFYFANKK